CARDGGITSYPFDFW
nr:immunoglobulin heavy chain junction region [Macaca mulatta]